MAEELNYAGSGVDIDLEGNAVGALVAHYPVLFESQEPQVRLSIYPVDSEA